MLKNIWRTFYFGLFVFLSWYVHPLFSLIAWVPLWQIIFSNQPVLKKIGHCGILFFIYNVLITYWLTHVLSDKGKYAIVANSILMTMVVAGFLLFQNTKNKKYWTVLFFISLWCSFEYLHNHWAFTWSWLTLGNGFSSASYLIQWYSITGVLGGTVWILVINFFIFTLLQDWNNSNRNAVLVLTTTATAAPILISALIYVRSLSSIAVDNTTQVGIVHTNINYTDSITARQKIEIIIDFLKTVKSTNLDLLVLPELTLENNVWMNNFSNSYEYQSLKKIATQMGVQLIVGGEFLQADKDGANLYEPEKVGIRYNKFNGAVLIDSSNDILFKTKKIFIPVVELMPEYLFFLFKSVKTYSSIATNQNGFKLKQGKVFVSICYESTNSNFIVEHWNGEQFIAMLASETFFNGSKIGMQQYINLCRLRAIELNRWAVKVSNEGISAVINNRGEVVTKVLPSDQKAQLLSVSIPLSYGETIYTRCSLYINYVFMGLAFLYIFSILLRKSASLFTKSQRNEI